MIKDERLSHTKEIEPKREKSNPYYCGVFAALALSRGQALRLDSRALPRRRRTLKRDEHGARFFLHQEMRRLACVSTKKREPGPRKQERHSRKRYDRRSCRQCPAGLILSWDRPSKVGCRQVRRGGPCLVVPRGYRTGVAHAGS